MAEKKKGFDSSGEKTLVFRGEKTPVPPQAEQMLYRNMANNYGADTRNFANNYGRGQEPPVPQTIHAYNNDYRRASQEQDMEDFDALSEDYEDAPSKKRGYTGPIAAAVTLTLAILAVLAWLYCRLFG